MGEIHTRVARVRGCEKGGSEAARAKRVRCALRKSTEVVPGREAGVIEWSSEARNEEGRKGEFFLARVAKHRGSRERSRARVRVRVYARI